MQTKRPLKQSRDPLETNKRTLKQVRDSLKEVLVFQNRSGVSGSRVGSA